MRFAIAGSLLLLTVVTTPAAFAQSQVDGYVFAGPGKSANDSFNFGAIGAEFISSKGIGLGVESGQYWGIGPYSYERHAERNRAFDIHFVATTPRSKTTRVSPFFLGGVSLFSHPQDDTYQGFVIGAGFNVWMTQHIAVRIDGRVPFFATNAGGGTAGIGITLRP